MVKPKNMEEVSFTTKDINSIRDTIKKRVKDHSRRSATGTDIRTRQMLGHLFQKIQNDIDLTFKEAMQDVPVSNNK